MPHLRKVSGKECLKILCNKLGFSIVRQRGSHVILTKMTPEGKVGTVVPMHKEIKIGTLKSVLKLGKISEENFLNIYNKMVEEEKEQNDLLDQVKESLEDVKAGRIRRVA